MKVIILFMFVIAALATFGLLLGSLILLSAWWLFVRPFRRRVPNVQTRRR